MSRAVQTSAARAGARAAAGAPADRIRPNARLLALLALGHLVVDINQGAIPAILPFLKAAHGLSYAAAGTVVLASNVTSSVIQPLFGYLSDRTARRGLLPLSVLLSGLGLAFTGVAPDYAVILALVLVTGLGIAAWHPEGYRTASGVAGDRKATGLSWFSFGGNIGIALGPPLVTTLVTGLGLAGSLGMLAPALLVALLLLAALPYLSAPAPAKGAGADRLPARAQPAAMALLVFVVMVRSWTQLGFTTFVPFYYVDHLRADPRLVGPLLFVFLAAGALGTIVAGPIADRIGPRRVMQASFLLVGPLAVGFLFASGAAAFVALAAVGFALVSTFTISVVLAQQYMPRHLGMASGLIVGFAVGAGGLGVALLGWVADHWGLMAALWSAALLPLVGFAAALLLPEPRRV